MVAGKVAPTAETEQVNPENLRVLDRGQQHGSLANPAASYYLAAVAVQAHLQVSDLAQEAPAVVVRAISKSYLPQLIAITMEAMQPRLAEAVEVFLFKQIPLALASPEKLPSLARAIVALSPFDGNEVILWILQS